MSGATLGAVMFLAAACGSGGTSPGGTGTGGSSGAPASSGSSRAAPVLTVCQDVDSVRAALRGIVSVSVTEAAVSEIEAVARGMAVSVADLGNTVSGREEWQSQIDAVKSELARLQSAASSYQAAPDTQARSSVLSAKASVAVTARRLLAAVGNRCPAPSATPAPSP
jgi:hypothetical protein